MASPISQIVTSQFVPAAQTTLFTCPAGTVTRIDKLTVSNVDAANHTIAINVVPAGASAGSSNNTTPTQAVLAKGVFNSPNEYGLCLNPGDSLSAIADVGAVLVIAVAGTQVTG